jgi:hypothetical protein
MVGAIAKTLKRPVMSITMQIQECFRALGLCSALCLAACRNEVRRADLFGQYQLENDRSTEQLDLHRDGSYVHLFVGPSGVQASDTGTWIFEPAKSNQIAFSYFTRNWDNDAKQAAVVWVTHVQSTPEGEPMIAADPDKNLQFRKRL